MRVRVRVETGRYYLKSGVELVWRLEVVVASAVVGEPT